MQLSFSQFNFAVVQNKVGETKHGRPVYRFDVVQKFLVEHGDYNIISLSTSQQTAQTVADALNQSIKINVFKQLFAG